MKLAREKKFVDDVTTAYKFERNNNHVLDIWKEDRRKEQEEYDRQYKEWLAEEEKKSIEFYLQHILREGWREEFRDNEQMNDEDEGYTCYVKEVTKRVKREMVTETLEQLEDLLRHLP